VKVRSGSISLFPSPAVRFEGIAVGKDGNVRIAVAAAHPDFASVMSDQPQLKSLELEGVTLDGHGLGAVLFGRPQSAALGLERIHATRIKLAVPGVNLPELEATASMLPDGSVQKILVNNPNQTIKAEIVPSGSKATVELTVGGATALLGLPFEVDALSARGVATATEFNASELDARLLDGLARGKGTLRWPGPLAFDASFELKQLDAKRITPILAGGRVQGTGVLAARGESLEKLASSARFDGSISVSKGQIAGVDLARTLQAGKSVPGSTNFNQISAQAQLDNGRLALRGVKIDAGALSASGAVEIDGGKSLAGRFAADMKTPGGPVRATLVVSGSPSQLAIRR
jgi:autotransporter translocation and assembly factor TamB